jgi:hypothetical protein
MQKNTTICGNINTIDNPQGRAYQNGGKLPPEALRSALAKLDKRVLWYLIGYTYADGCITIYDKHYYSRWKSKDRDLIEYVKSVLDSKCKIQVYDEKYYALSIGSKDMVMDFMSMGIVPNKTYMTIYPTIDIDYFSDFTRGYFDGDGCVSIRKEKKQQYLQMQFVNKRKENLQSFGNILKSELGLIPHIYKHEESFRLCYTLHASLSLYWYMYKDATTFYLKRKKNVFDKWLKERNQLNYGRRTCEVCHKEYSVLHDKSRVCYKCKMKIKSDLIGDNKLT